MGEILLRAENIDKHFGITHALDNVSFTFCDASSKKVEITNVSYDPTRELYAEYNKIFQKHWKEKAVVVGGDVGLEVAILGVGLLATRSHGAEGAHATAEPMSMPSSRLDVATTRVVQMEPGPTPTLTASTPASIIFVMVKGNQFQTFLSKMRI